MRGRCGEATVERWWIGEEEDEADSLTKHGIILIKPPPSTLSLLWETWLNVPLQEHNSLKATVLYRPHVFPQIQINIPTRKILQTIQYAALNMCHLWAISLTSSVGLTQTRCRVIKRAVILLGLLRIWCKCFPQHSSLTKDPVDVANCFSLSPWLVSPWLSSLPALSWLQHSTICPTYSCFCLFKLCSSMLLFCFNF